MHQTTSYDVEVERAAWAVCVPEKNQTKKKPWPVDNVICMGDVPPETILMKFGTIGDLADIIYPANFGVDQFRGFSLG